MQCWTVCIYFSLSLHNDPIIYILLSPFFFSLDEDTETERS